MDVLEAEKQFFLNNREALARRFAGKVVVIRGNKVVLVYDNVVVAERETSRDFTPGSVLIQRIERP